MKLPRLLLLALLGPLAACSPSPVPTAAPAAQTAAPAAAPMPAATPASVATPAPATPPTEPAPQPAPTPPVAMASGTPPASLTAGTDYEIIPGGTPFEPGKARVEVVEFFNYICPACNSFQPQLSAWKAAQPAGVRVVYVPADFRADFVAYARAFYAADSFNLVEKSHDAVYTAIHGTGQLPAEGAAPDESKIAAFYAQYGVGASMFEGAMRSFAVDTKLRKGRDFMTKSKVQSTPSLVINGRYLVKGRTFEDKIRIADALVKSELAGR